MNSSATCKSNLYVASAERGGYRYTTMGGATYILDLGFDAHVGIDARDEVLYRSPHALIARRILPPRPTVIKRERGRIITPRNLRWRPCSKRQ